MRNLIKMREYGEAWIGGELHQFEITLDVAKLLKWKAVAATRSKSKKSTACGGGIVVRHVALMGAIKHDPQ